MQTALQAAQRLTGLLQVSASEWAGPCPACGGRDRFRLWPDPGRYWCRGCGVKGDMIQFARDYLGLGFRAAAELAGKALHAAMAGASEARPAPSLRTAAGVPSDWQDAVEYTAWRCFFRLWEPAGKNALAYLRGRGLSNRMIGDAGLGFNPTGRKVSGRWWLAPGVTIPLRVDGELLALNVRRLQGTPKYQLAAGSRMALWGADRIRPDRPAVLVESALDALSVAQVAGDLCTPLATGSTTGARRLEYVLSVAIAPLLLVAFDADDAGDRAAAWWLELPNAARWRPQGGKDANEKLQAGTLREWIEAGLIYGPPRAGTSFAAQKSR